MNKINEEALDGFTLANRSRLEWIGDFGLTPEETAVLAENRAKANASKKVGLELRAIRWRELEETSDYGYDWDHKVEVGGPEDNRDLAEAAIGAEGSEAEEFLFMQRAREQRRKKPPQIKIRPRDFAKSKFSPQPYAFVDKAWKFTDAPIAAIGISAAALEIAESADPEALLASHAHIERSKDKTVNFVTWHNLNAIDYRQQICSGRPKTAPYGHELTENTDVSPLLPLAQSSPLFQRLPDPNGIGEPISEKAFWADPWRGNSQELLFHVMKTHEGELAEVIGEWVPYDYDPAIGVPTALCHPQFAWNAKQFGKMSALTKPKGNGKGKRKGQPLAAPSFIKDPTEVSAIGETRVLRPPTDNGRCWHVRSSRVVSLPRLFYELGKRFNACELLAYWSTLQSFAIKKPHGVASAERQMAAQLRYEETGRYGWGR